MPVFGVAIILLAILAISRRLGFRCDGFVANLALWFCVGVLAVPLLAALSCFCAPR